jgi:hypothetical protein
MRKKEEATAQQRTTHTITNSRLPLWGQVIFLVFRWFCFISMFVRMQCGVCVQVSSVT